MTRSELITTNFRPEQTRLPKQISTTSTSALDGPTADAGCCEAFTASPLATSSRNWHVPIRDWNGTTPESTSALLFSCGNPSRYDKNVTEAKTFVCVKAMQLEFPGLPA